MFLSLKRKKKREKATDDLSYNANAFNSLPNDNFLRLVQIQSICRRQNKCKIKPEILFWIVENIAGKGENASYQHFLLFPRYFQNFSFSKSLKVRIVW